MGVSSAVDRWAWYRLRRRSIGSRSIQRNPHYLVDEINEDLMSVYTLDFQQALIASAKSLKIEYLLDARLRQDDDPRILYLHRGISENLRKMRRLKCLDDDYGRAHEFEE